DRWYWADRARVVFELAGTGDAECRRIVDAAAAGLAKLAVTVGSRLSSSGPVVLAGGLAVHQPALQQLVRQRLAERHFTDVRPLGVDPVRGAVELAQQLLDRAPSATNT